MATIDTVRLREMLIYDPATGQFRNRESGRKVGHALPTGYWQITFRNYSPAYAHRLAWQYVFGEAPACDVDHINRDRSDNRIVNLRLATRSLNHRNSDRKPSNKSGYKGVSWSKQRRKWVAFIRVEGKSVNLGGYADPAEAHAAYCKEGRRLFGEMFFEGTIANENQERSEAS